MASENFPVIIRCQDTDVAVPIKTLIDESTIFKALYESVVNKSSALSGSGRDSGCSLQDIQDLPCDEVEAIIENHNEDNEVEESEADDSNSINQNNEVLKETSKVQQKLRISQQFDIIDLSNFEGKSVRILFNSLLGHPELIEACNSLDILYGVLKICDEYGIASPIPQITTRFKTCDTITMANMLDAMKIAKDIEKMKNYVDISAILIDRCVSFARWNLASWQVLLKLVMENKDQFSFVVKIITKLKEETDATIRFKVNDFSKLSEEVVSSTCIINHLGWKIKIQDKDNKKIGVKIQCENPNKEDGWLCKAKATIGIVNQKTQEVCFSREINHRFKEGENAAEISDFSTFESVLDHSAGFIKDNQITFEVMISVEYVKGVSNSLNVSEEDIGWYSMEHTVTHQLDSQVFQLDGIEDTPVIFCCKNSFVAVNKKNLIKESSVFHAMFKEQWTRSDENKSNYENESNIKQIELSGYKLLSVKYLMEYIQGYPTLLKDCKDILVIADMLKLSDFYDMKSPIPVLLAKISNLPIEMSNVTKAFEASVALQDIAAFKDLSTNLSSKCIQYLRFNIASWQVVINFLVDNRSKSDLVIKMIEMIAEDEVANIRFKTEKINKEKFYRTHKFIHQNTIWFLDCQFQSVDDKESYLQVYLFKKNSDELKNPISCNAGIKIKFHKRPYWNFAKDWNYVSKHLYNGDSTTGWGNRKLLLEREFLDPTNGYIKDGYSYFEFELEADEPTGIPESLGVTEDMII